MKSLAPLVLLIFLSACSNKGTNNELSDQQIMPLAVGNSWTFMELPAPGFSGDTTVYTQSVTKDTLMSITINSVIDIGHWFKVAGFLGMPPTFFANRSSGFFQTFFYFDGTSTQVITTLVAKYPATVGDLYSQAFPPPIQNVSQRVEVLDTDSVITVPAGTFTCYVYRITLLSDGRRIYDAFYSVGTGLIKSHFYELAPGDNRVTSEVRLIGFDLK